MASNYASRIACPSCGRELPPVEVVAKSEVFNDRGERPRNTLTIVLTPIFDTNWWMLFHKDHSGCAQP